MPVAILEIFTNGKNYWMADFITHVWTGCLDSIGSFAYPELSTFLILVNDEICRERQRLVKTNPENVVEIIKDSPFFKLTFEAAIDKILYELKWV